MAVRRAEGGAQQLALEHKSFVLGSQKSCGDRAAQYVDASFG
jgi:hypothetical protein